MTDSLTPTDFDFISRPEVKEEERVWCRIGTDNELELFDWEYVESLAREYDALSAAAKKSNAHIICKLAVLIREQTLHKASEALLKYAEVSAEATTIIIKDPLEEA